MPNQDVLVVLGSPRADSNSGILAQRLMEGVAAAGGHAEAVELRKLKIGPCLGCDHCREHEAQCFQDDDMQALYPKLVGAKAIVIACPIYWFTVNAQTKLFMDRWYALGGDEHALRNKRFGVILTYGDVDPYRSGAVNAIRTFQDAFAYIGAELVGLVYGSADKPGEMRTQAGLLEEAYELGRKLLP